MLCLNSMWLANLKILPTFELLAQTVCNKFIIFFLKLLGQKAIHRASIWRAYLPLFHSFKHATSVCIRVNVCAVCGVCVSVCACVCVRECVCVHAHLCLLALCCGSSLMQQVCRTWGSSWSPQQLRGQCLKDFLSFPQYGRHYCCRKQMIYTIPNLLPPDASVAKETIPMVIVSPYQNWLFPTFPEVTNAKPGYAVFFLCIVSISIWSIKRFCIPTLCPTQAMNHAPLS